MTEPFVAQVDDGLGAIDAKVVMCETRVSSLGTWVRGYNLATHVMQRDGNRKTAGELWNGELSIGETEIERGNEANICNVVGDCL